MVVRHRLQGSGGEGIELVKTGELPDAPLYVRYIPKHDEYRVHVALGEAIDVQRKARDTSVPDDEVNWQISQRKESFSIVAIE